MNREQEIREVAYRLWEQAGRPEGRALEFWLKAETAAAAGDPRPQSSTQTETAAAPELKGGARGQTSKKATASRSRRPG